MRDQGLWATHLGPELGGQGYGQLKLALLNEILGRSQWAPIVFGCQAPDTGNAEIIAHYGTPEQKERYLRAAARRRDLLLLLDDRAARRRRPDAVQDPAPCKDGDEWVINGWKFFSSNARTASFLIVMAVTNPDVSAYQGMSMFLVPTDTPGVEHRAQRRRSPASRSTRARTRSSTTTTCACRPTRCSAARARPSRSRRPASAAAASTTPCAPSAWRRRRST